MGHKHSKDEILAGAVDATFESGFKQLTYGRVAKHLGINDRTVVYYFPSKQDLVAAVLAATGVELQRSLAPVLTSPMANHLELARRIWPALARPEADAVFALFFEANGLAASGHEPYCELVPALVDGWILWTAEYIEEPSGSTSSASHRRAEAEATVALLDGLLLLRQLAGPRAANRAAKRLGVID